MSRRPFASSADLEEKRATLEELADGVYAFTADGDPNVGAIVGSEGVLCIDGRATPSHAREWLEVLRTRTDRPIEWLVLTHYHAVRVLGASAFDARHVVAHENTRRWIYERGADDWESEYRRFPRLFRGAESIPGLTYPDVSFADQITVMLGEREVQLLHLGGGHTIGDIGVWLPQERIFFSGDLVEANAAPYMGDASIAQWITTTLERVDLLGAETLVPGRGPVVHGREEVRRCVEEMRAYMTTLWDTVRDAEGAGATLRQAFDRARAVLEPVYGHWAIFDHCLPFSVARAYDEAQGREHQVWTAERDAALWEALQD